MKVLICDICRKPFSGILNCATIEIGESITLDHPKEINLCSGCTNKLLDWVVRERANAKDQEEGP